MSQPNESDAIRLHVNGAVVDVIDDGAALSEVLRDRLRLLSVKDGCSPQGQCGCCTVLVDGKPRVSCVTPIRRVAGRTIETMEGLPDDVAAAWAESFVATGASQCGFCSPGIVMRFEGLRRSSPEADDVQVNKALMAHLCRCTGWQSIVDAWHHRVSGGAPLERDAEQVDRATRRATLEAGVPQRVGPDVVLGAGGFVDDTAPAESLVAVRRTDGSWATAPTMAQARVEVGKVQGRRTTVTSPPPVELPSGDWVRTLQTSWVDGAYLELDASWCEPDGEPASPRSNGGGFGGKVGSPVPAVARRLADECGTTVRVRASREDVVRFGVKRPPVAIGLRADGSGVVRVGLAADSSAAVAELLSSGFDGLDVEFVSCPGPPTSLAPRGSVWVEVAAAVASLGSDDAPSFQAPGQGLARVEVEHSESGSIERIVVTVDAGDPLDDVVLSSYVVGATHMGWSLATSESIAVIDGEPTDLTVRSFGVLKAGELPRIDVVVTPSDAEPVPVGTSVMAAAAHAAWRESAWAPTWPTGR